MQLMSTRNFTYWTTLLLIASKGSLVAEFFKYAFETV